MKKQDLLSLLYLLAAPIGLILAGAILAISPDVLTRLITRFLGWAVLLIAVGFAIAALVSQSGRVGKLLWALVAFSIGSWLVRHPLGLAAQAGAFLGILLILRGIRDCAASRQQGRPLAIATIAVGVVLLLSPLAATRIVFSLCGVAMVIVGILMALDKWKSWRYLDGGGKSDIIDAL